MELVKRASPAFGFVDGSEVTFEIEAMSREVRKTILAQSRVDQKNFEKTDDDELDKYDAERFVRLMILRVVKGWSGLKNKHLLTIYNCSKGDQWQFKGDGKRETEIPFTPEALRELAEMHSENFRKFLNTSLKMIDVLNVQAKEAELKN